MNTAFNQVDAQKAMMEAMRASMPGLKTQAQFNAFMAAFDALRLHGDAIFRGDLEGQAITEAAMFQAIDLMRRATRIANRAEDPEVGAKVGTEHTQEPIEFTEYDQQKALLTELAQLPTKMHLDQWYEASKPKFDSVKTQELRNVLFDAIRDKRISFTK